MIRSAALALALCSCLPSVTAFAHTDVVSTDPADGATLDAAPETLRVRFAAPLRVVKASVTRTAPDGARESRAERPAPAPSEELTLAPGLVGTGDYAIVWRALGDDGHVVEGGFAFRVR